ncbi:MAG TPA: hypothetical protein VE135_02875, partial [Pyrinomonadaceae bacterium]|nr:hypothetical protein [Pyrinomonadaceae bacterium]
RYQESHGETQRISLEHVSIPNNKPVLHKTSFSILNVIFVLSWVPNLSRCMLSAICDFLKSRAFVLELEAAFSAFAETSACNRP